jgi:hypothetical protein
MDKYLHYFNVRVGECDIHWVLLMAICQISFQEVLQPAVEAVQHGLSIERYSKLDSMLQE